MLALKLTSANYKSALTETLKYDVEFIPFVFNSLLYLPTTEQCSSGNIPKRLGVLVFPWYGRLLVTKLRRHVGSFTTLWCHVTCGAFPPAVGLYQRASTVPSSWKDQSNKCILKCFKPYFYTQINYNFHEILIFSRHTKAF